LVALGQGDPSEDESVEVMREFCERVHVLPQSKPRCMAQCLGKLFTGTPLQAAYTESADNRRMVEEIAASTGFDLLHVEHIRGAHLVTDIQGIPRVFDSVDCITRLLKKKLTRDNSLPGLVLGLEELLKMRSYEPRIAARFDSVAITSQKDKRVMEWLMNRYAKDWDHNPAGAQTRRLMRSQIEDNQDARLQRLVDGSAERVVVVRNGVDNEYFQPMDVPVKTDLITFSGKMSYFPNVSAALWFYHNVFPLIKQKRPQVVFRIVGSNPANSILKLSGDPSVQVTGFVPDIRPHIADAGVVVCPLTVGVGIQNKVLEAMAMAKPVVATDIACSGIPEAVDNTHLVRADSPREMADKVLALMDHPSKGRAIGKRACELVKEQYSWRAATRFLEKVHAQAAYEFRIRNSVPRHSRTVGAQR
jgi:glycosyltransferase involved in cell wall biosynthesis